MRNEFYCDALDVLKWTRCLELAQLHGVARIHHLAFLTPDRGRGEGNKRNDRRDADPAVRAYVRDEREAFIADPRLKDVRRGALLSSYLKSILVTVDARPFEQRNRSTWIGEAARSLRDIQQPAVILLDPDNGVGDKHPTDAHVRPEEFAVLFSSVLPKSVLVVFQHQQRRRGWADASRSSLSTTLGSDAAVTHADGDPVAFLWAMRP